MLVRQFEVKEIKKQGESRAPLSGQTVSVQLSLKLRTNQFLILKSKLTITDRNPGRIINHHNFSCNCM